MTRSFFCAAHNERLVHIVRTNRNYYFNFRIAALYTDEEADAAVTGHEAIIRALLESRCRAR